MLSSRFAGIPISSSIIDEAGVPQLLTCGEQTLRAENPAQVAGFISEWWPESNRNGGRLQIGIGGRIESEFAVRVYPDFHVIALVVRQISRQLLGRAVGMKQA